MGKIASREQNSVRFHRYGLREWSISRFECEISEIGKVVEYLLDVSVRVVAVASLQLIPVYRVEYHLASSAPRLGPQRSLRSLWVPSDDEYCQVRLAQDNKHVLSIPT